jgi:hypothetical protein
MKRIIIALGMVFLLKSAIAQTKGNWQQEVNYTIKVTLDDQRHMLVVLKSLCIRTIRRLHSTRCTFTCGRTRTRINIRRLPSN